MSSLVSVVIRTYNRAAYLREAVESVLGQTYRDFELIVVDDGSTDETSSLLDSYAGKVRVICLRHTGHTSMVLNAGVRAAHGELVAILDSDDVWLTDKLERQVELLAEHSGLGFVYGNGCLLYPDGRVSAPALAPDQIIAGSALRAMVRNNCVHPSTAVVRRSCLEQLGHFDERYIASETFAFFLRLARVTQTRCVPEPVCLIRQHASQLSREHGLKTYEGAISALVELLDDRTLPLEIRLEAHRSIARYRTHLARTQVEAGEILQARRLVMRALQSYPLHRPAWRVALRSLLPV
jgi:glycosyltransferase involved in cell wall biosynthesis